MKLIEFKMPKALVLSFLGALIFCSVIPSTVSAQDGAMVGVDAFFMEDGYFDNVKDALVEPEKAFYLDLSLQSPKLRSVPEEVYKLTELKYLELAYNQIGSVGERITELVHLETLGLNGNKYLKSFNMNLSALVNLKEIHVQDTGLSSEQLDALEASLPEGCKLVR